MQPSARAQAASPERPWLFAFLIAPPSILAIGLVNGALAYLLRQQGIDPARDADIVALLSIPHTIYFLWCPIADFGLRRRTWILAASAVAAALVCAAFGPTSLASPTAIRLLFAGYCAVLLVAASCGGLMGDLKSERNRRRAGSFYQCGSLVFGGIVVFGLVSLAGHVPSLVLGIFLAALIVVPSLAAFAVPAGPPQPRQPFGATLVGIGHEFRRTFLRWDAIPYALLITMPMCSGAMIGLLPALAADFHVGAAQVAWMNGIAGILLTAAGSMAAALIPTRVRAPIAYLCAGLVNATTLALLALGSQSPAIYFTATVAYLFSIGACYALFTGVVLEFLGGSGKSGGARYALINSFGNLPVAYMSWVDGRGYAHWGARGMPGIDAALSAVVASLLLVFFILRRQPMAAPAAI